MLLFQELRVSFRGTWLALSNVAGDSLRWPLVRKYLLRRNIPIEAGVLLSEHPGTDPGIEYKIALLELLLCFLRGHVGDNGLLVKASTVPAAGQGLFVTRNFPKNTLLCVYRGTAVSLAEAMRRSNAGEHGDYVMGGFGANLRIDAGPHPEVLARYINDDLSEKPRHNVKFVKLKTYRCALVITLKGVEAGDELFAFYGQGYWKKRRSS